MRHSDSQTLSTSILLAVLSAIFMGTIGIVSKTTGLSADVVTFYRLFFGAAIMLGYLVIARRAHLLSARPPWQVVVNGIFLASFIVFYVQAMNYTSMANAIMLIYLAPITASIIAHFWLKEHLTPRSIALIATALFGFAMMMEFKFSFNQGSHESLGLGFGVLSMAAYAGFILINRIMPASYPVLARTWYQLLIGALCMLPFLLMAPVWPEQWQWGWLLAAGLIPGFLAILFAVSALNHLHSSLFGTLAYFEPVAVVTFGWVLFDESLNTLQLTGCGVIMLSGIIQAISSSRQNKTLQQETAHA
ncbi:DMT family transporter [Neptunomonas marina]|uniref:DMT family transporter n=1 Tax=Neptunomonas marina TaxID=1815562 RepID=A0A437QCW7_9GAMM|nr:DMT family transporter [Neptunomonas marina]RVU32382.1 DMT family transporter [Neptunomonas marina]